MLMHFRLLQLHLAHKSDYVGIYDGILYNKTSEIVRLIKSPNSQRRRFIKSTFDSISLKVVAQAASSRIYGFIAEIVSLPIAAIGFGMYILLVYFEVFKLITFREEH